MIVRRTTLRSKVPTSEAVPYVKGLFPKARVMRPQTGADYPATKIVMEGEYESMAEYEKVATELWARLNPGPEFWAKWRSMVEVIEVEVLLVQ